MVIPDRDTEIGFNAFNGCTSLTDISIPDSITEIGSEAFENCPALNYNEYGNALYLGNESNPYVVLAKAKNKTITECEINANCKIILAYAFRECRIESLTIPAGVKYIGGGAFWKCNKLTTVTIPEGVNYIGSSAFRDC